MDDKCLICGNALGTVDVVTVTRGRYTLIQASVTRGDGLALQMEKDSPLRLHSVCRKNYTRTSSIKAYTSSRSEASSSKPQEVEAPVLRSAHPKMFDFKRNCLFCGDEASLEAQKKLPLGHKNRISEVQTIQKFQDSVRRRVVERNDNWGQIVLQRLEGAIDLVAAEAKYHRGCHKEFYGDVVKDQATGRPEDWKKHQAFEELCAYLEDNDECQYSISDLHNIMGHFLDGESGYTTKHLKTKLQEHYGDRVTITELPGKHGVVSFRDTAEKILHDKWYTEKCTNIEDERTRIVKTAAAIVREDIRTRVYDCDTYPAVKPLEELGEENVPQSLQSLIDGIINPHGKGSTSISRKSQTIMQSIIAATRPRSFLSPLNISIAVYLHRKYGSRDLIDLLNSLGICASYKEVQRYEYSQIVHGSPPPEPGGFVQFVFDNADFNVNTIDGHNTFHSMGGLKCHTPAAVPNCTSAVSRQLNPPNADVMGSFGKVQIKPYINPTVPGLQQILVKDILHDTHPEPDSVSTAGKLDSLWIAGCALEISPRPSWNGFMQVVMQNTASYEISHLEPLPFINMAPTNLSTIYTALCFAQDECKKQGVNTCFVTFDQPLFQKASEIVASSTELDNVVVRLGGFHLLMSYMGAVGNIMSGSGLEELWTTVYAKASVAHMTTGHAYSRGLRAHFLTQEALATILLRTSDSLSDDDQSTLSNLYRHLLEEETSTEDALATNATTQLKELLKQLANHASAISRTANLWIQYFEQVNIMRLFVRAERTGDWELHLYTVAKMLPHLHAAGHHPYAKSAHLYVQQMRELSQKMTLDEYNRFTSRGFFTIRRSDKFWCGVWSDMTIEQVLMRAIKTSGGLTRGRGISESTLAKWVLALPLCVPLCNSLETFAGINPGTSEQHKEHKELLHSRQLRDNRDLNTFMEWLDAHPPFGNKPDNTLVSLATGIVANESINCDEAELLGSRALQEMIGKPFTEIKLRRKDKVKTLGGMTNTVQIRDDEVTVNPLQLFSRIACVINSSSELSSFLKYELAPRPTSLFDDVSIRKSTKAALATLLESLAPSDNNIPEGALFVVDGGHLLHSVTWPRPATYDELCQMYVRYVIKHYQSTATVVFDGYGGPPTTKSVEQNRRASKIISADIMFTGSMHTTTTQAGFLANGNNKSRLIRAVSAGLREAGLHVVQAPADADTTIVSTAIDLASSGKTVVLVGTDTDLLVLLIARAPTNGKLFMLRPSTNSKSAKVFNITTIQQAVGRKQENLLFLHAITGCDTTSALYGQGKKKAFRLLMSNDDLAREMTVFNKESSRHDDVSRSGEKFLLALYGGTRFTSLDEFRYYSYKRNIANKSVGAKFTLASLPPTSAAARQHSLRTFLQVQQWLGNELSPTEWGWKIQDTSLLPVTTDLPPAPQKLMKLISCNCKAGCTSRCGCRQAGMSCSAMCSQCMGIACSNVPQAEDLGTVEDE